MAKTKNKRKSADSVRVRKSDAGPKINPFEIKFSKKKHDVLTKNPLKSNMPGLARSRSTEIRKNTLLVEYKKRGKSNKFIDKRFAHKDSNLTEEEKMLERFARERKKTHDKSNMFSLNDDDELTHFGQSLSSIEKFDKPDVSDDDEDDSGIIGADLVGDEHFGGLDKKSDDKGAKSWKQRMEEIIATNIQHKAELKALKNKAEEDTRRLDEDWKELKHILAGSKRNNKTEEPKSKSDDYDIMVRELQFAIKGQPTSRTKTEEEIAKEEKERLEELEADRLRRMKGLSKDEDKLMQNVYRSADDLEDGFNFAEKKVRFFVSYDEDGKIRDGPKNDEQNKGESEENEISDVEDNGEDETEDDDDEESDDAMDHSSDLESDEELDESSEESNKVSAKHKPNKHVALLKPSLKKIKLGTEDIKEIIQKKEENMETAKKELPYMFKAPETYENLLELVQEHSDADQLIIIDRLIKLYHPSLAEGNKEKLQMLYTLLVEYYCDLALQDPPLLTLLDSIVKPIYQLTNRFQLTSAQTWYQLLQSRHQEFSEVAQRKGGRGLYPSLDTLLSFKLIAALYPTSDFHHPIITPATLFMSQILAQCPVLNMQDLTSGLLLCAIFYQYVAFAKRFVPELLNFLRGVLFLAVDKSPGKIEPVCPPFKPVGNNINLLVIEKEMTSVSLTALNISKVFSSESDEYLNSVDLKVLCVYNCLKLVLAFMNMYEEMPAWTEIFQPIVYFVQKLTIEKYPDGLKNLQDSVLSKFECMKNQVKRQALVLQKNKPKPLKLFEPRFDLKFDGKKKLTGSKEKQEHKKLLRSYKREMKGAIRQVRQDNNFLAREKIKEEMTRDAERKRKVNLLMEDLAKQEGDFQAMKRAKEYSKEFSK